MSDHMRRRSGLVVMALICVALGTSGSARQTQDAAALRDQLRGRYDVLALQDGVGLVPRNRDAGIRIIEIRNGAVSVDGQALTGAELRQRLAGDTDMILRVTYLDAAQQQQLAGGAPAAPGQPGAGPLPPPLPSPVPAPLPSAADTPGGPRVARQDRDDEIVRINDDVTIDVGQVVDGDVVVIMGDATVNGEIQGELTVVGGNAVLSDTAIVRQDVTVVGGRLTRAPGAVIEGDVENVEAGGRWWGGGFPGSMRDGVFGRVGSLAATLFRIGFLALLAVAIVAFGRHYVEAIADRAAADPLRSGLTGFLAQVLFLPVLLLTVVILAISIIGIPLLLVVPFAVALLLVAAIVGFTGVAYQVGRVLADRFGWADRSPYVTVLLGVGGVALVTVLARLAAVAGAGFLAFPVAGLGYFIEYLAWTFGIGAEILRLHQVRRMRAAPAVS
jgi:hypothetical protein